LVAETDIAPENRTFTPVAGQTWVRETLLPIHERLVTTEINELYAILRYTVHTPKGSGTEKQGKVVQAIKDAFAPQLPLDDTRMDVTLERSEAGVSREVGVLADDRQVWNVVPVDVVFRAYTKRQV